MHAHPERPPVSLRQLERHPARPTQKAERKPSIESINPGFPRDRADLPPRPIPTDHRPSERIPVCLTLTRKRGIASAREPRKQHRCPRDPIGVDEQVVDIGYGVNHPSSARACARPARALDNHWPKSKAKQIADRFALLCFWTI
jgi:hypothetical protein